jgi:nucleoside-triphosphatase THEP1
MNIIYTGKINEGKTTALKNHYEKNRLGDGFISVKKMIHDRVHSYISIRLSTNEEKVILVHEQFFSRDFLVAGKIGPYIINLLTLQSIEKSIKKMIANQEEPIYLDEIGVLELKGYGYDYIFKKMVSSKLSFIISVREDLVDEVISKYQLKDVEIIHV